MTLRLRSGRAVPLVLIGPACGYLLIFFVFPLARVLLLSVTDPRPSLMHFTRLFHGTLYLRTLLTTFETALIVTVCCLLLGYPLAYAMSQGPRRLGLVLLAIVAISFWTSFLVRTYAWMVILGSSGPLAAASAMLGLPAPAVLFTTFSSDLGMVHILLPYMVMAVYAVMQRIEPAYRRAASSLGAPPFAAFREVFLPLSLPGVINGCLLVFTICLGFYVTPALLGSPRDMMISQLIAQQIEDLLDWGFASSLSVVLFVATAAVLLVYNRLFGIQRLWN